jgi:tetratricopeptide (TPR) repeat protein
MCLSKPFIAWFSGLLTLSCQLGAANGQEANPAKKGENYALLVGVTRYVTKEFRPLPYAERDVAELAKVLRETGYRPENVVLLTQTAGADDPRFLPTAERIRDELRLLLKNRSENDCIVIGLAGHGVHFKGDANSYFCPADVNLEERKNLISLSELYKDLESCKANLKVLLVDACRNDPFLDKSRRASADFDSASRPAVPTSAGGVVAFFSCSEKEQAFEHDDLRHGVFFHFVIEGLRGGLGDKSDITIPALGDYVGRRVNDFVRAKYGKSQTPEIVGKLRGVAPIVRIDEAVRLYRRGKEHLRQSECDQAIAALSEAIERDERLTPAFLSRAECRYYRSEIKQALADLESALRLDPENRTAKAYRALILSDQPDGKERAKKEFENLIQQIRPTEARDFYLRGLANIGLFDLGAGDIDKAIADLTEAIRLDPKMEDALVDRAGALARKGEYDQVIAEVDDVLRLNPRNAVALGQRAYAFEQKGDYDRAISDNTEALRLNPKASWIRANRGSCYLEKGERERALADLSEAIRSEVAYPNPYARRGRVHVELGKPEEALSDFDEAIRLGANEAWVYAHRGDAWHAKKDYAKAIADYTEAIRLDPDYAKSYRDRGYTYVMNLEKYDAGLADLDKSLELDPDSASAHNLRGIALYWKEDYDNAVVAYDEAIRLKPDEAVHHSNRANAVLERAEFEDAVAGYTAAIRLDAKNPERLKQRARAYSRWSNALLKEAQAAKNAQDLNRAESLLEQSKRQQQRGEADEKAARNLANSSK